MRLTCASAIAKRRCGGAEMVARCGKQCQGVERRGRALAGMFPTPPLGQWCSENPTSDVSPICNWLFPVTCFSRRSCTWLGYSPPVDYAIHVSGLRKGYGDRPVLWDLDLTVAWGELLVLFGANGAGKTTLLRILSTQARPDAGTVSVAGFDVRKQGRAVRRRIGVVGHQGFLYDDLTCRENLAFYGRLFGVAGLEERVETVLARVGMTGRSEHRVRTLSHGMTKRLAIARAILHARRTSSLPLPSPCISC